MLNISPMADGTIPQQQLTILSTIGSFLKQNGTAIYDTRAWTVYGEGPTKMGGGSFTNPTAGTSSDVRYTKSKDGSTLYAVWMGWPGNGKQVTMASVTTTAFPVGNGKVYLFGPTGGSAIALTFTQDGSGLHVTLPSTQPYTTVAYAMEISPSGSPPGPTPWLGSGGAGGAGGMGGTAGAGGGGRGGAGQSGASGGGGSPQGTGGAAGTSTVGAVGGAGGQGGRSNGSGGRAGSGGGGPGGTGGTGTGGAMAGTGGSIGDGGAGAGPGGAPGAADDAAGGCNCRLHEGPAGVSSGAAGLAALVSCFAVTLARRRRSRRPGTARRSSVSAR